MTTAPGRARPEPRRLAAQAGCEPRGRALPAVGPRVRGQAQPRRGGQGQSVFNEDNDGNNDDDQEMSEIILDAWTSFIKTGKPVVAGVDWQPVTIVLFLSDLFCTVLTRWGTPPCPAGSTSTSPPAR